MLFTTGKHKETDGETEKYLSGGCVTQVENLPVHSTFSQKLKNIHGEIYIPSFALK